MAEFKIRVNNERDIKDKPRVYFTCHPDDFARYFEKVVIDLFKTQDCAIFYTEDLTETLTEENIELDLNRMNLVVVPVTFRLLMTDNRAMKQDIPEAMRLGVPVLPLMMESGIEEQYSRPDKFGERQFIRPYGYELTEIPYEKKLANFLGAVLTSDEVAKRVRAAFYAYVFLSYRKKDRAYANELIKLIHANSKYRDVAIWYDEFLTPGENFRENISQALANSKIFALLVTPNLLENPNYIIDEEFPAAKDSGISIIPVEMIKTERSELEKLYDSIPDSLTPAKIEVLYDRFSELLSDSIIEKKDSRPEHNYLIGIAYLNGIDVEVDRECGIQLITLAAEADFLPAMKKLLDIYNESGRHKIALKWAEKIYEYCQREYGVQDSNTISALKALAKQCSNVGDFYRSIELFESLYCTLYGIFGEKSLDTLKALSDLAMEYCHFCDYDEAVEYAEKAYNLLSEIYGDENCDVVVCLKNLSDIYHNKGEYSKAVELREKICAFCHKRVGSNQQPTLWAMNALADSYDRLGDYNKAISLKENVYNTFVCLNGEDSSDSRIILRDLGGLYAKAGDLVKEIEAKEKILALYRDSFGDHHAYTIIAYNDLARAYDKSGAKEEAQKMRQLAEDLFQSILTDEIIEEITDFDSLIEDFDKTIAFRENIYNQRCKSFGENHMMSEQALIKLIDAYVQGEKYEELECLADKYDDIARYDKAIELRELIYDMRCEHFEEEDPDIVLSLVQLAISVYYSGDINRSKELIQKAYFLAQENYGEEDEITVMVKNILKQLFEDNN